MTLPTLPDTITLDYQPYGSVTLGNLHWAVETERDYNNGGTRQRTVLRGVVLAGCERSYLFGHVSSRDATGQHRTVYGVRPNEIACGHITRIAS
jgi:hypothetical protein